MTRKQAALYLGLGKTTVRRREGTELTPHVEPNGAISFDASEVEKYRLKRMGKSRARSPAVREPTLEEILVVFDLLDQGRTGLAIVRALSLHPNVVEELIAQRVRLLEANCEKAGEPDRADHAEGSSRVTSAPRAPDSSKETAASSEMRAEAAPNGSAIGAGGFSRAGEHVPDEVLSEIQTAVGAATGSAIGTRGFSGAGENIPDEVPSEMQTVVGAATGSATGARGFSGAGENIPDGVLSEMQTAVGAATAPPPSAAKGMSGSSRATRSTLPPAREVDAGCDSDKATSPSASITAPAENTAPVPSDSARGATGFSGVDDGAPDGAAFERIDDPRAAALPIDTTEGGVDSCRAGEETPLSLDHTPVAGPPVSVAPPSRTAPHAVDGGSVDVVEDPPCEYEVLLDQTFLTDEQRAFLGASPELESKLRKVVTRLRRSRLCFDEAVVTFRTVAESELEMAGQGSSIQ